MRLFEVVFYLLDELPDINQNLFNNLLDLNNIGFVGHSFGGTTVAEVCIKDSRVKAGVNLDGYHIYREENITQPFMIINAEDSRNENEHIYDKFSNHKYIYTLHRAGHMNFSDEALISPIMKLLGMTGEINPYRALEITNDYITDFFDKYLKQIDSPLLNDISTMRYREMELNLYN